MSSDDTDIQQIVEQLRALADPDRLLIAARLREGSRTSSDLSVMLDRSQDDICDHLHAMECAGLVHRDGFEPFATYSVQGLDEGMIDLGCCQLRLFRAGWPPDS